MLAVKVVFLGDASVGKTALLRRIATGEFSPYGEPTIGTDCLARTVTTEGRAVTLQLWDTAGQERYQSLGAVFYRGSEVCVLVYDITDSRSFDDLAIWREEFLSLALPRDLDSFPFLVVGTKTDREAERQVPFSRVQAWSAYLCLEAEREVRLATGMLGEDGSRRRVSGGDCVELAAVAESIAWWALNARRPASERLCEDSTFSASLPSD